MSKNHGRKQRARHAQKRTGGHYASAAAGALHRHRGPVVPPVDAAAFGRPGPVRMDAVGQLVGAVMEGCRPCQAALADQVLDGDRVAAATLIGLVLSLLPAPVGQFSSDATATVFTLAADHSDDGVRALVAHLEGLDRAVLADVLEDVLDYVPILIGALSGMHAATHEPGDALEEPEQEPASPVVMAVAVYHVAAGVDVLVSQEEIHELLSLAEGSASSGRPVECALCDEPIDVTAAAEVNLGLAISQTGGGPESPGLLIPVWTHPACGRARIWAHAQLNAARRAAGLPIWGDDLDSATPQSLDITREPDWFTFSRVRHQGAVYPLLVIQPGRFHPYGMSGHLADMLSMGLRRVDLMRDRIEEITGWQVRMERGRVAEITRRGAGAWWRADAATGDVDVEWKKAGKARRQVVLLVLPPGWLTDDQGDPTELMLRACAERAAYGGLVAVRGTFF
ncbi:hypothetical protein [Streptosporangium sandarakinum]|uniref:hypothetical protein n=1 Tax=Streptosporangium sandarakinum TaxID=1260955 RepID=UPI00368BFF4C